MWVGGDEANETSGNELDVLKQKTFILSPKKGILNSSKRAGPLRQRCTNSGPQNFGLRHLIFMGS